MSQPRIVFCKKLKKELPGLPFRPFTDAFGQELYDNVSMEAWQMWIRESPRYINTAQVDLQSQAGRDFIREQMRVFFGFDEGEMAKTFWRPPEEGQGG